MTTPSQAASAYGAQMAKYFTLNQPPHVAIDSAVSVVRPQLAITRLIARSGIPERTASIPARKSFMGFAGSSEPCEGRGMGTLDRQKKHKDGGVARRAESPCATLSQILVFETRGPSTGSISMFPGPLSMPLRMMLERVRLNASTVFTELLTPFSTT